LHLRGCLVALVEIRKPAFRRQVEPVLRDHLASLPSTAQRGVVDGLANVYCRLAVKPLCSRRRN